MKREYDFTKGERGKFFRPEAEMADFKLWCFCESGNAYKAALMLNLCGLAWEAMPVDFFNGETRAPAYRDSVNEMGEAPVLQHGAVKLAQSGAILTYLSDLTGKFGGRNEAEKLEILSWILFDNHKFTSYVATLRFMIAFMKTGETPVVEFLRGRAATAAGIVEKHLAVRAFMVGERLTIADLSLCGYLYYPEDFGFDWAAFPHIAAWLARIKALPGWKPPYEMMARAPARRAG